MRNTLELTYKHLMMYLIQFFGATNIPKEGTHYTCMAVICIESAMKMYKKIIKCI